jgi:uncharacterized protein YutE (UPF0331/DUF86 family)
MHLDALLIFLRSLDIIDENIFQMMMEIKNHRNKLAHKVWKIDELRKKPSLPKKKLILNGLECIKVLHNYKI